MSVDRSEVADEIEKDHNYFQIMDLAEKKYPMIDTDDADKMLGVVIDWLRGGEAVIRAKFLVRCDGPCRGWLSLKEDYRPGADVRVTDLVLRPTAERAARWPGERSARIAAQEAGWSVRAGKVLCPDCRKNPLGIHLPPPGLEG